MKEEKEVGIVIDDTITVDLDTIIKEAVSYLKSFTGVTIDSYEIRDNKISMRLDGNKENIRVLKDRLGVQEESYELSNNIVDKVKANLAKIIKDNFSAEFDLKLKSMDSNDPELVHISLELNLKTIPYPIRTSYHIACDGYVSLSYSIFGDKEKDETWSSTSTTLSRFVDTLKGVERYYSKGLEA